MHEAYRRQVWRKAAVLGGLSLLLLASLLADLAIGPARYAMADVVAALWRPDSVPPALRVVVWDVRLPAALMALLVGAALSMAGAQMQTILNNPLASPFTLGLSAAASFGASLAMAFGVSLVPWLASAMVPVNAFVMALVSAGVIYGLSKGQRVSTETVVLLGIALVFTFNALLAAVQVFSSEQAVAAVVFWTMGSLGKATWGKAAILALALALAVPLSLRWAWALTALRLGDDKAASLGVNVARLRLHMLVLVSLLAALPVAFVGTIGFIGLVGPHIARFLIGEDQRFFLPASLLSGALLLSASAVVSKLVAPGAAFPIGIVTSIIGVPLFFVLILRHRRLS